MSTERRGTRGPSDPGRRKPGVSRSDRSTQRPETRRRTAGSGRSIVDGASERAGKKRAPALPEREIRRRFTGRAAVLAAVLCLLVVGLAYPLREYITQRQQIAELEAKKRQQEKDIGKLQRQQQRLQDPAYIEQQARRRLHYAKPGEITYVVIDDGTGGSGGGPGGSAGGQSWYERLWSSVHVADRPGK
ncbi:MAG: FtsB family cell division protein [Streptosporangiales bacterium]